MEWTAVDIFSQHLVSVLKSLCLMYLLAPAMLFPSGLEEGAGLSQCIPPELCLRGLNERGFLFDRLLGI